VILLTGATGLVGGELLPLLLSRGEDVRVLVRDPRRLGANRVNVQIALGDLADPFSMRHALRGVDTVIHLAATIRDQPAGTIEELNGLATCRLLRAAERVGVERFVFFSAMNATDFQRTRFFQAKALAERAVLDAELEGVVMAPSIVYGLGDPWITILERLSVLPAMPISGAGDALYEPIWARDVARCVAGAINGAAPNGGAPEGDGAPRGRRYELAGPQVLSYDAIVEEVLTALGRSRPLVHLPLPAVRAGLRVIELLEGEDAFATWDEVELMEVPMTSAHGTEDARALGVDPQPIAEVLSGGGLPTQRHQS
jgi:NADH dehydrogenase